MSRRAVVSDFFLKRSKVFASKADKDCVRKEEMT